MKRSWLIHFRRLMAVHILGLGLVFMWGGTMKINAQTDANVNLLYNGSFERTTYSGIPDCWSAFNTYGSPTAVSVVTPAGDYVLRIIDSSASFSAGLLSDAVPVVAGGSYTASAFVKRIDTVNTIPSLYLKYYNSAGTEVGSFSVGATGGSNVWQFVSRTGTAPATAVSARVLCYSNIASTGSLYFDGVALCRNVTETATLRYVSNSGSGTGTTAGSPALYNSSTFWDGVQTLLATQPVKVIFQQGDYVIDTSANRLVLSSRGHATHQLTLEGETPFGTVFTRTNSATVNSQITQMSLSRCQNVKVRHLHWENDTTDTTRQAGYGLTIASGTSGTECINITVEGCTFTGLDCHYYGALGIHHAMTHDVLVKWCEFVRGGSGSSFHMIYNAYGPYNLTFTNNYFQDCRGSYLRLRAGCYNTYVGANEFVSTSNSYYYHFVQIATFNDVNPGDETWGYNHTIENNLFNFQTSAANNVAISLHHSGFDPYKTSTTTWDYLPTAAEKAVLIGTNISAKKALLINNYGLDNGGSEPAVTFLNNTRQGYHFGKVRLSSVAAYGATPQGGEGYHDISNAFPLD